MADRNGYNHSKFQTEQGVCFICKRNIDTARHEIFYGNPNRENSKREGMWIDVCPLCHDKIHANPEQFLMLKEKGQQLFEVWRPRAEFIAIFGKNYL